MANSIAEDFKRCEEDRMSRAWVGQAESLRTTVMLNPEATLQDFFDALPQINRGSMANRFRESHRVMKEMEN